MVPREDGFVALLYELADDNGKPLKDDLEPVKLASAEIHAFATICYQAWEIIYNRAERPQAGSIGTLGEFRGEAASYVCDAYGVDQLVVRWAGLSPEKPSFLRLPREGVSATLVLLAQTPQGKEILGDGERFRAGMRKEPVTTPFKEQEEIDLSGSIVSKADAANWGTWTGWVGYQSRDFEGVDFRLLSDKEKRYLSVVFARRGPPSESQVRMNSDAGFLVRLKLNHPETLNDLQEAFRTGYLNAYDAADACRRARNVRLLPIAAGSLYTDKAPREIESSDVIVDPSPSIHSANAILGLLVSCPEFPGAVRTAAATWVATATLSPDFRGACRAWWEENKSRISKGAYHEITPPSSR